MGWWESPGVDTRALVRRLRDGGAINGAISSDGSDPHSLLEQVRQSPSMEGLNLAAQVSTKAPYEWNELCQAGFDQRQQAVPAIPTGSWRSISASSGASLSASPPMVVR